MTHVESTLNIFQTDEFKRKHKITKKKTSLIYIIHVCVTLSVSQSRNSIGCHMGPNSCGAFCYADNIIL